MRALRGLACSGLLLSIAACAPPAGAPDASTADASLDGDALDVTAPLDTAPDALPPLPDAGDPDAATTPAGRLRRSLGIPDDARRVLIFGQNSHLDLDWLRTQEGYYTGYVERIYSEALDAIAADPAYRYATAEMGFLRMFYERKPERREALVRAIREGRFQIVGGGVSQPDTLVPTGENLLRDYQQGAQWLASIGAPRTRSAYLPDSFGLSASTPDVLRAAGFDAVAFWRADGNSDAPEFNASVADFARLPVVPGTNAARLRDDGAIDFLWEGPGGAQVFTHWLTNGYMFGDYLDFRQIAYRQYGKPVGQQLRDPELVAQNISTIAGIMFPQSPTDYAFVPIGGDFQYPKANLARLVEHWNRTRARSTGIWVRAGTFDEFAQLAMTQRERLRVRQLDVIPYWMGFFASRPALKDLARRGAATLDQAHKALSLCRALGLAGDATPLRDAEWTAGATNHHDWVTGTSVDAVLTDEQMPRTRAMYDAAQGALGAAVTRIADALPRAPGGAAVHTAAVFNSESYARDGLVELPLATPVDASVRAAHVRPLDGTTTLAAQLNHERNAVVFLAEGVPSIGHQGVRVELTNEAPEAPGVALRCRDEGNAEQPCDSASAVTLEAETASLLARFDLARGATLTQLRTEGFDALDGGGFELVVYEDSGGLYTFGHEGSGRFSQGYLPGTRATARRVRVLENGPARARVAVEYESMGLPYRVEYTIAARGASIDAVITARTAPGTALLARFSTALTAERALMAVPGGAMPRPRGGRFTPTFVPFEQWFSYENADGLRGVTLSAPANPAITFDGQGTLDLVLHRNAPTSDRGPNGLGGSTNDPATLRVRLSPYARGRTRAQHYRASADAWFPLVAREAGPASTSPVTLEPTSSLAQLEGEALVSAARAPGDGSSGLVLRLLRTDDRATAVRLRLDRARFTRAERIDASERSSTPIDPFTADGPVTLDGALTSLRLR